MTGYRDSLDPGIRSLLVQNTNTELGLGPDWVYRILKQVGKLSGSFMTVNIGKRTLP